MMLASAFLLSQTYRSSSRISGSLHLFCPSCGKASLLSQIPV